MTWGLAEGLPGTVTSIAQSTDGYLWFGTYHGVLRFDGARFELFTPNNADSSYFGASMILSPAMKSPYVTSLVADKFNRIWIGTYGGGVSRIENGTISRPIPGRMVYLLILFGLVQDRSGNIWIGAYNGALCRVEQENRIVTIRGRQTEASSEGASITEDGTGELWLTDHRGVLSVREIRIMQKAIQAGPARSKPITMLGDGEGRLWLGTRVGAYCLENGRIRRVWPVKTPSPENAVCDYEG